LQASLECPNGRVYRGPLTFIMLINGLEAADMTHKHEDDKLPR